LLLQVALALSVQKGIRKDKHAKGKGTRIKKSFTSAAVSSKHAMRMDYFSARTEEKEWVF